ncbi:MAG: hypothetical protein GY849_21075 [Deltaproteobacteria bacterium]|nr:hypothetical protein [Deltaproteobacteria bacterium]
MNASEINAMIRHFILEEKARKVSPDDLTHVQTSAISLLSDLLVASAPEYFEKKVSLSPVNTNIHHFQLPSDNRGLKRVWDYDGNVGSVSGTADNGSGAIRVTHDLTVSDEDIVVIHDVAGCTEANGTWQIDYITSTTFDLVGSTYTNAWTSGGKVFLDKEDTYKYPIERMPSSHQKANNETRFFNREDDIIIDDPDFENDLIILYRYHPSTLTEIPTRMHTGIYAYGVLLLAEFPDPQKKQGRYLTIKKNVKMCEGLWGQAQAMASGFKPVLGTNNISKHKTNHWL